MVVVTYHCQTSNLNPQLTETELVLLFKLLFRFVIYEFVYKHTTPYAKHYLVFAFILERGLCRLDNAPILEPRQ